MERRKYAFTIPNYSTFSDDKLLDTSTELLNQLKAEFISPHGILLRTKRFATLFVQLSFVTQEMERRRPGILAEIDQDIELDRMLDALNIKRND